MGTHICAVRENEGHVSVRSILHEQLSIQDMEEISLWENRKMYPKSMTSSFEFSSFDEVESITCWTWNVILLFTVSSCGFGTLEKLTTIGEGDRTMGETMGEGDRLGNPSRLRTKKLWLLTWPRPPPRIITWPRPPPRIIIAKFWRVLNN
jgi:hypothetical protein